LIPAFLLLGFGGAPQDNDLPRLRTQLENRTTLQVERMPSAKIAVAQMWLNTREFPEGFQTHGFRHLLEHIQVQGVDRQLDQRLESAGMFISASTYRDSVCFTIQMAPSQLPLAMQAFQDILRPVPVTAERIAHEAKVIRHEEALRQDWSVLFEFAWLKAYGSAGLHPGGNPDVIAKAELRKLSTMWLRMTSPENVAVVMAGNLNLDAATDQAKLIFEKRKPYGEAVPEPAPVNYVPADVPGSGGAIAAKVGSYREAQTAARLAVGMVVSNEISDAVVQYDPSNRPGLVLVGSPTGRAQLSEFLQTSDPNAYFGLARLLVLQWLAEQSADPKAVATLRGQLLVQSPSLRPETLIENLRTLSVEQFRTAWKSFEIEVGN